MCEEFKGTRRGLVLDAVRYGGLSVEDRLTLLASVLNAQEEELAELRHFRAVVCKAAVWFAQPGSDAHLTGFQEWAEPASEGVERGHVHGFLIPEAREAVAQLAALDTSLWALALGSDAARPPQEARRGS